LIVVAGHDRGRPIGLTHYLTPRHRTGIQASGRRFVPNSGTAAALLGPAANFLASTRSLVRLTGEIQAAKVGDGFVPLPILAVKYLPTVHK
jgi:hypothetical protein